MSGRAPRRYPNLRLVPLGVEARSLAQAILEAARDYFAHLGEETLPADLGERLLLEATHTPGRHVMAITLDEQAIGLLDFRLRYPAADTAYLGLIVLAPAWRGRGYGTLALDIWETWLATQTPIERVRLGVAAHLRRTLRFFLRRGYHLTGEARRVRVGHAQPRVLILEKHLTAGGDDAGPDHGSPRTTGTRASGGPDA